MILFLALLSLLFLLLSALSFRKVGRTPDVLQFIYAWGALFGSFIWEDLFVYGLYFALVFFIGALVQDIRIVFLMFGVFWIVRSVGETIYFFLQQFHTPKHHPHDLFDHYATLRKFFGPISEQKAHIIMQVTQQSITMVSISAVIWLLRNWDTLPATF